MTPAPAVSSAQPALLGPVDQALHHATFAVPIFAPDIPVADALDAMHGRRFDSAAAVAVLDPARRLVGIATVEAMFAAPAGARLGDVMDPTPPTVAPDTDQEHAAWQAVQRAEPYLAVVDSDDRFLGLIPPHRLLGVLLHEHDEDLARLGGFLHTVESTRSTSVESVRKRLWHRVPWLIIGLLGAMTSAVLMTAFDARLNADLAIAYFVPGIVYLADAVGTQTETLAIRGLSVGVGIRRIAAREALTGLCVGVLLGAVMWPLVTVLTGNHMLSLAVSLTIIGAGTVSTLVAMWLPWLLHRLGKDPAFGAGPLATVLQDLLSILLYFGAVSALLS
ncbi:magnesium transporter MgtE [Mycolicibacterium duvalii]|uniref:Magnesium transporter n=1 Tax=Mycolicibacterium duvalii TaxID=39688 RepID=A0A7I7K329_9MYCO|nr:magnesium transporter [Mycolicibacterium duvalii]PEG39053.1 magnesium transporter MgtE [Mycolicibacterium duvalii]BBX18467.1 magnesium transporter [Mycolicibacterium duvalii]